MKLLFTVFDRLFRSEDKACQHINVLTHYADDTLLDKSGRLIKIIKLSGIHYVTESDESLDIFKIRLNNLLKNISSEFALYVWDIKRKSEITKSGDYTDNLANQVNSQYFSNLINVGMFHKELYIALVTKQPEGLINKMLNIFQSLCVRFDKKAKLQYIKRRYAGLCELTGHVVSSLTDYQPVILSVYEMNNAVFSKPFEFISLLINGNSLPVARDLRDAPHVLTRNRMFFNRRSGTLERRSADNQSRYAAVLSIKGYSPLTHQGYLDIFDDLNCEYVITQSYRFYDKQTTKGRLRDQQYEMMQSNEESASQTAQIEDMFDEAAGGGVGYGKHHLTFVCYADSEAELNRNVSEVISRFADLDITCVREDIACETGFWAQLPGNFGYIARAADISTRNFAGLASLHNQPLGKAFGNYWGDPVTIFETQSGSPYYFNFHHRDVGNFLVFGAMGSGKTLLVGFLILQSMKFGGKRVIFDKDRGLEIAVRAMRGTYDSIKPGKPTGFNPCQLPDTEENRNFLESLLAKMVTISAESLDEADTILIHRVVDGLYRLKQRDRRLSNLAPYFGHGSPSSLRARFDQWHGDGPHAWLFDNQYDSLNLDRDVIGFDIGHILKDEICKTPALMYLIYRVEQALEGTRGIIFIDEGWMALADAFFKKLINDFSRTLRKKNNIFGLATQVANDTIQSSLSRSINESAFTKFFFPNPMADRDVYINHLGLTERQYELIKTLPDNQYYFLLDHGRGADKESVVARINLSKCPNLIKVISAREETLMIFDRIITEVGNDPDVWLPIFYERTKECV